MEERARRLEEANAARIDDGDPFART